MSNNADLIKAIKDAENAIAKAISTLQVESENHNLTKAEKRRVDLIEEAVERVLSRRDEEKRREQEEENKRLIEFLDARNKETTRIWMEAWSTPQQPVKRGWFK